MEEVLGFGKRLAVWLGGCPLKCKGCIAKELQNQKNAKEYKDFYSFVKPILKSVEGITFSGGEPLFQAEELLEFLKRLPKGMDKMLFTGYYKKELNEIQLECYNMFDLVVEGRFEKEKMGNFLYRGSSNQLFSSPTGKYSDVLSDFYRLPSAGIEVRIKEDKLVYYGIPTKNDEIAKLQELLKQKGIFSKG